MNKKEEEKLADVLMDAICQLLSGFSVALYGLGSKISVLDGIESILEMKGQRVIRIKGYDQTFPIIRTFGKQCPGARSENDIIRVIEKNEKKKYFILVDSIDGLKTFQDFFASLAALDNVYLCATMDHCRVGLLWSPSQLKKFQWYWLEANTFEEYTQEVVDLVPFWDGLIENKAQVASDKFSLVVPTLTINHRKVCYALAQLQLAAGGGQIRSNELLAICKKEMIANTKHKLNSLMVELFDHKIVMQTKEKDTGNELFWIPFDPQAMIDSL